MRFAMKARSLLAKGVNPHSERKRKACAIVWPAAYLHGRLRAMAGPSPARWRKEGRQTSLEQIGRVFKKMCSPRCGT